MAQSSRQIEIGECRIAIDEMVTKLEEVGLTPEDWDRYRRLRNRYKELTTGKAMHNTTSEAATLLNCLSTVLSSSSRDAAKDFERFANIAAIALPRFSQEELRQWFEYVCRAAGVE